MNLKGNDFLKLLDYTPEQIDYLLRLAAQLKAEKKAGIPHRLCEGIHFLIKHRGGKKKKKKPVRKPVKKKK